MAKDFKTGEIRHYPTGRLPSPFDARDYNLANYMPAWALYEEPAIKEISWDFPGEPLDQGSYNHCVGFSMAHFGINSPINTMYTKQDGHDFYYKCKFIDQRPYVEEGTYIRSGAKVLVNEKRIEAYAFARNIHDIKWWLFNKGPIIMGTIWCVGKGTKVLTSDLRWVPVEDIEQGLEIVGFDENPNRYCSYRKSNILSIKKIIRPSYEIVTDRGRIVVSEDHQFVQRFEKTARKWTRAKDLKPGDHLNYMGDTWETDTSKEAGWISGFYDGEGTLSRNIKGKRNPNTLSCIQVKGEVLDYALNILSEKGFSYTLHPREGQEFEDGRIWQDSVRWNIIGENAQMRFVGTFRPIKLLKNASSLWEGRLISGRHATVKECNFLGDVEVYALGTSTKTLMTDGYFSHNCMDMFTPNADNIINIGGAVAGGHAYLINEWRSDNYIGILNSWDGWGKHGKAYIAADDLELLFTYQGEALTAIELPHPEEDSNEKDDKELPTYIQPSKNWFQQLMELLLDFLKKLLYN